MAYTPRRARSRADAPTMPLPRVGSGAASRGRARGDVVISEAIAFPVMVGIVHWLIVQVTASLAYRFGTLHSSSAPYVSSLGAPPDLTGWAHVVVDPLRLWDGLWYSRIADLGYGLRGTGSAEAAFWPLLPWLMRLGHRLAGISVDAAGYVVANVSFFLALILLYRLVSLDFDQTVARRTLWALALFPTALFFSAVYTESLFLLLAVGALLAARLGTWWVAGAVGLLAALTRSNGVLLLAPFAVLFFEQYRLDLRRWFPNVLFAAMPVLGPLIFAYHLNEIRDDPTAFFSVQTQWDRYQSNPIDTLRCAVSSCPPWHRDGADWGWVRMLVDNPTWGTLTSNGFRLRAADSDTLELVVTVLFLALALVGLRLLPLYQSAYAIPPLVLPLFQPSEVHALFSMPRFVLVLFPFFVVLALLFGNRRFALPALAVSTVLLILLTMQFANWYWVS